MAILSYFKFFGIPVSLSIDNSLLKQKFYTNSKSFHPDFFTLDSVEKQMEALEQSTLNNKAYNTLKDFDSRLKHLLEIKNVLQEEGNNSLPQEFLMEMMDVNEAVMDLQFDFDEAKYSELLIEVDTAKASLRSHIKAIIPKIGDQITAEDLAELKDYYLKSRYLIRLEENIQGIKQV